MLGSRPRSARARSLVRDAWGLPPEGGLVVAPDECAAIWNRLGLLPAERLTILALLRGWNPRKTAAPVVQVRLEEMMVWTGLSRGRQSDVVSELVAGWNPGLLAEVAPAARGRPRVLSLAVFLRLAQGATWTPERVPPAERNGAAMGSAGGTHPSGRQNPLDELRSAGRTHSSVNSPQTLATEKEEGVDDLRTPADLRKAVLAGDSAAAIEWARRKRAKKVGT